MSFKRVVINALIFLVSLCTNIQSADLPSTFGKTNFIIGVDSATVRRQQRSHHLINRLHVRGKTERIAQVFFSPDDDARLILLDLIACEKKKIRMAAFLLTDGVIAQALLDAQRRGVTVEVVTDKFCCRGKYGKMRMLHAAGIDVLVYSGNRSAHGSLSNIMHHKFIVFSSNVLGRSILWTGSFNFTHSARLRNQENVLVLDDQALIARYAQQFDVLKARCTPYRKRRFTQQITMRRTHRKRIDKIQRKNAQKHERRARRT